LVILLIRALGFSGPSVFIHIQPKISMQRIILRFAGTVILISLLLAHYHSPNWLWVTAFVGFNLLQSSFTNFCPLEIILKKFGVGGSCCSDGKSGGSCCSK